MGESKAANERPRPEASCSDRAGNCACRAESHGGQLSEQWVLAWTRATLGRMRVFFIELNDCREAGVF